MSQAAEAKDELVIPLDAGSPASTVPARPGDEPAAERALADVMTVSLPPVPPAVSGSGFLLAGLVLSALLHVGLLLYLQSDSADDVGPGGVQLEAVSVDLVPLSTLRAGAPDQAPDLGMDATEQDKTEKTEAARREVTDTPPPEALVKPTDDASELAAAEIIKPDPSHERRDEEADNDKPDKPDEPATSHDDRGRARQTQQPSDPKAKGGASVAATPGQMSRYALSIRQALSRNRPQHLGTRGRAVVAFGITGTGSVRFAQIVRSSGAKVLDDTILSTIWKIRFPAPPHGMTDQERSYTVPFDFR